MRVTAKNEGGNHKIAWVYHNFERNEIRATVFLKWTDFSSSPFAFTYKKPFVLSNKNNLKSVEICWDQTRSRPEPETFGGFCGHCAAVERLRVFMAIVWLSTSLSHSPTNGFSLKLNTVFAKRIKIKRTKQNYITLNKRRAKQKSWLFWIFVK